MTRVLAKIACLSVLTWSVAAQAQPDAELWEIWQQSDESNEALVNHSRWQHFLDSYVETDALGVNLVKYADVTDVDHEALRFYLETMQAIDPRNFRKQEQYAYWINLYNAATIDIVLQNPGKSSILRMGVSFFSAGPWNDEVLRVAGIDLTLNDIEHRILRPIWRDQRVHFAVNCASMSCPNLAKDAYTSRSIERLLDKNEHDFINDPRGVRLTPRGRLEISKIFDWYRIDFAATDAALVDYLASHAVEPLATQLKSYRGKIRYEYDWSINAP